PHRCWAMARAGTSSACMTCAPIATPCAWPPPRSMVRPLAPDPPRDFDLTQYADKDRIVLAGLAFYGYHGVMMEENALGQRFRIDLELGLDMDEAARTDDVGATISYAHIYDLVKEAFEEKRFKLIEAL